jgi:glycosyltransferase involved in cell wall biosynthesis
VSLTVVIPCYNAAATVEAAVASARGAAQIVVVDDGSLAETARLLDALLANNTYPNLEVVRLPQNAGLGAARNAGVARASQPWVAFLDADDVYLSHNAQSFAEAWGVFAATQPRGHWFFHTVREWSPPAPPGRVRAGDPVRQPSDLLLKRSPLAPSATVLSTSLAQKFPFQTDRRLQGTEDLDLWIRLLYADFRPRSWSNLPWTAYRIGTGMSSALGSHAAKIRMQWARFVRNGWIQSADLEASESELQRQLARSYHKAGRFLKAQKAYQKAGFSLKNKLLSAAAALGIRL